MPIWDVLPVATNPGRSANLLRMTNPILLVLLVMMCGCRDVSQDPRFWAVYFFIVGVGLVAGRKRSG